MRVREKGGKWVSIYMREDKKVCELGDSGEDVRVRRCCTRVMRVACFV